jgi:RNA polymerase sigma factor (TIGR02999 family)
MGEVTILLQRVGDGDAGARERLFELLYEDLRKLAHSRMRRSETITLLDTTSLVHDAYLRLVDARQLSFEDRGKFFAYAASVMRAIVVDAVRARRADRRGGDATHVVLDTQVVESAEQAEAELISVHDALQDLAKLDERLVRVVEMRYFAGLSEKEIAGSLGVTERTVRRDWEKARALLFSALK